MATTTTLPSLYQEFIALSRYSKFQSDLGRREKWGETVDRSRNWWKARYPEHTAVLDEIYDGVAELEQMPSMRSVMTAGPALDRDHMAAYNCAASAITGYGPTLSLWDDKMPEYGFDTPISLKINRPIVFDELFYILLCGAGVGFSVERQFIAELPTVGRPLSRDMYKRTKVNYPGVDKHELSYFDKKQNTIYVADSKYGWASSLRILIVELYNGNFDVKWDVSAVRPAGTPLKTFGGRASGPQALEKMFENLGSLFKQASGRKLNSIEAHDTMCFIAEAVVVGGVRRSALLSLSNLSDERMRYAKSGEWWVTDPQRALANNSTAYTEKPTTGAFMREWQSIYESKSGERGILNREVVRRACVATGRDPNHQWLFNPCVEAALRDSGGLCNLTSIMVRPDDTFETLARKARNAAILGTFQATLIDFVYVSPRWKKNCEEERLLGVSLTGTTDHPILRETSEEAARWLRELAQIVRDANAVWAQKLGINKAAAATVVKPEGTVSQLTDTGSGLHERFGEYYYRRVRADAKDPLAQVMRDQGFPCEADVMQPANLIFTFPIKSPETATIRGTRTAVQQLEYWRMFKQNWCDSHNPSITVYVKEEEWPAVGAWVFDNFDDVCGVSFLPHSDHIYQQAPYEECTKEEYEAMLEKLPKFIDYEALGKLETTDLTTGMREFACVGGACEI